MVYQWISIHAPTKGATAAVGKQSGGIIDFNPRSHEGSDGAEKHQAVWKRHFNPRSHEGSDKDVSGYLRSAKISIHAPTKGATVKCVLQ